MEEGNKGKGPSEIQGKNVIKSENQELGGNLPNPPITTETTTIITSSSSSTTCDQIHDHQEVKKEEDEGSITETGNLDDSTYYFDVMSGNLDAKVQQLKDRIQEKKEMEEELAVLQQCLEMEIPPEEITEEITLNTVLIVDSVKELVRLIDSKEEEIQALSQEVDTGLNISIDYYADKAESDDDKSKKMGEAKQEMTSAAEASMASSDDSDTLELVGSSSKKRSAMMSGEEEDGDNPYKKLDDSDFFNKFNDDFDDTDIA